MDTAQQRTVRFLFDPGCPFTWRTSKWIREARQQTPIEVQWEPYALEYVNRDNTASPHLAMAQANRPALRLVELARLAGGNDAVDRLYLALGTARHERSEEQSSPATLEAACVEAGLDPTLVQRALTDTSHDDALWQRYEHLAATGAFGVPTLFYDGDEAPFYGPVLGSVPTGAEALALWHDVTALAGLPYFFELKRARR